MRKYIKAGVLLFVLVAPVLVFLFLKVFGQNHYTLRTFYPLKMDTQIVGGKVIKDTIYHKVPTFRLTSQDRQLITEEVLDNHIYVANFFRVGCTDICPKMLSQLSRVQDAFESNEDVKIVSYAADSSGKSMDSLVSYAKKYEAMNGKWYFLTGNYSEIEELARSGYKVSETLKSPDSINFIQSQKYILIDKNRHIRGYYDGSDLEEVDRLILEIKILQYEDKLTN